MIYLSRFSPRGASALAFCVVLLLCVLGCASADVGVAVGVRSGPLVVELADFHDALSPYGEWIWMPNWGWVWRPWGLAVGWVPYSYGRWLYTDWGWYWDSSWDWGWAPFHYGRWRCDAVWGWVWLPGRTWAPAWVAWRHRPGWIGWAPLSPPDGWRAEAALTLDGAEPEAAAWSFVAAADLLSPRLVGRIAPRARNVTLLDGSQMLRRFETRQGHAVERGLPPELVERETGRVVERRTIEEPRPSAVGRRGEVTRDAVRPYRPVVNGGPVQPSPATIAPAPVPDARSRARVETWARDEQKRLEQTQRRERRAPPAGVTADELARRHEAERSALEREVERRQKWSPPPAQAAAKPKTKPKNPGRKPPPEGRG